MTTFSARGRFDPAPNRLTRALHAARAAGRRLLDLTLSNPTRADLPYPAAAIREALADARALVYEPSPFGLPAAREAVARAMSAAGPPLDPGRVVLTASTSEAYGFLFKLLCDPGDAVLVPQPSYPLFEHLARLDGVRPIPYPLRYDGRWHLDPGALATAAARERVRAILVVSPNNPTGSYLKRDELARLTELGLPLISDQVFADYPLHDDPDRVADARAAEGIPVFALGGLSKLAGLPQMKAAWIAAGGPEPVIREALARLELIADTYLSVSTPVQHALPSLLAATAPVREAIRARARRNLDRLRRAAAGSPASPLHVEGGWYAVVQVPRTRSEEDWALRLLEADDVVVHPGHFYDFEREAYLVVSLLVPEPAFAEGIDRLIARVEAG